MIFKVKYEKNNLFLMSTILILCLFTCLFWLILTKYIYALIYFVLTIFIGYTYYFTNYELNDKYLVIKLGFIKIKIKYNNIWQVQKKENYLTLVFHHFNINVFPKEKDIFIIKLQEKIDKQKFVLYNKK